MSARVTGLDSLGDDRENLRAFIQDEPTRKVLEQVVADLAIPLCTVHRGGIKDAVRFLGANRSPRSLVVDISQSELPLSDVHELAEVCEPGVTVVAIGEKNDVGLFRELTRQGVSDYLVRPISAALVQKALSVVGESGAPGRQTQRLGRLVATIGARGGVGTTMVATSLAWLIANKRRRRVALVDLDLHFGTVALGLDLDPGHGLREALDNPTRIDGVFIDRITQKYNDTLFVLSAEEALGEHFDGDRDAIQHLLEQLRSKFHFVIVDLPRHMSPLVHQVISTATDLVTVSDPSLSGMRDTIRLNQLLPTLNASCKSINVLNKVGAASQGEIGIDDFQKALGGKVDFVLPFDPRQLAAAVNGGKAVPQLKSKLGPMLDELSHRLCGGNAAPARPMWQRLLPVGRR